MNMQTVKEVSKFLAAAVFFSIGMLVLNPQYIATSSYWDRIVLQLLTFMNGLGFCLVLGLLVNTLWIKKVLLRDELQDEAAEEAGV